MGNFCTNCGSRIRKGDNFCINCGTEIIKDDNICAKCGAKIRKGDNFCINCGTKIDKSNEKKNNQKSGLLQEIIEKEKIRMAKEKEKENKKLKIIDEIFKSDEIQSEIIKNQIPKINVIAIRNVLKNKLINKRENMSEEEIKRFIKTELKKVSNAKIEENESNSGGYCNLNCRYCFEEFIDSDGGITGDFDADGYVDYYCQLGHPISFGSFCEYYE